MATIHFTLLGRFAVAVDGAVVPATGWTRRHAAALVKVLALAPGRRLHREQVIDLVWPDDTLDEAVPKLHKAAHFARRTITTDNAVVLRGDNVILCPDDDVTVDVVEFEELARRALADGDALAADEALAVYGGELLPQDRYEAWAEDRRDQLRLRFVDLLRLVGAWDRVLEAEPGDERAHVALMQAYIAAGDRHAALRQFERLDRVLRRELGVAAGAEARELRDRLLADHVVPTGDDTLVGRDVELAVVDRSLAEVGAGRSRTVLVAGPPGVGKSAFVAEVVARAEARDFRTAQGTAALVEGAWPYAPVLEALADLCRAHPDVLDGLADRHRAEIDRALAGQEAPWTGESAHQQLFVAAAELLRRAAASAPLLVVIDDVQDADDASLRLLHYVARSTHDRPVGLVLAHRGAAAKGWAETRHSLLDRHGAIELELAPLSDDDVATLVRRRVPGATDETITRIGALSRGLPFAVVELARRAAVEPAPSPALDADMVAGIPPTTRDVLQRVAVVGSSFDTDEFVALAGRPEAEAFDHLDTALGALVVEPTGSGYRFRHALVREALLEDVPPHRRRQIHRDAAARLVELGAPDPRIGHHLVEAGAAGEAVPYLLRAAEADAAIGAYRDALAVVDRVLPHVRGARRSEVLMLRGDLLNAVGDPLAPAAYREALHGAGAAASRAIRIRLARSAVMSGDLETAAAALREVETDGGPDDADILVARGKMAYFAADFDAAQTASDAARELVLAGDRSWKVLDLVALQGLLAHQSGTWFDRMRLELRRTRDRPEIANAVFDGYLCAAEYMLYGPMPYAEVIELAMDLQATAQRSGGVRAAAFASALAGEAAFLSGDLDQAAAALTEARRLHQEVGSAGGEAHSLQRLAEVRLAQGDAEEARKLLQHALPLARESILSRHLLQRVFGTMVLAAPDPFEARAVIDRAESTVGWDEDCAFCSIMLEVPASLACVRAGDLAEAHRHLARAESSMPIWHGTAWEAAIAEVKAAISDATGDAPAARAFREYAAQRFERAGQPRDAARCRQAVATV